jgi:predicted transcriptional regulator
VLDALVERANGGMTVFELRASVDADIDGIEDALGSLTSDGLVHADQENGRTRFTVDDRVVPSPEDDNYEDSLFDAIKRRIGL